MHILVISLSLVTLSSCSSSKHICDAYVQTDVIYNDTVWAIPATQLILTDLVTNNEQPKQPENPESQTRVAFIREENLSEGQCREA